MAQLNQFVVKDATTIRDDILRTIRNGLDDLGIDANVTPGSDWYVLATALGEQLEVVGANTIVKADQQMPDTAVEDDLARIADLFDRAKQSAAGSLGNIILRASATSPVALGAELTDSAGLRFRVTVGDNYDNGDLIPIAAIDTGAATNHDAGDILQWASAPPFADAKATVATGGLTNGIDAEDDEGLRSRILTLLQSPPGSGNWEDVAEAAEDADPRVQKAFVYPAVQGPATCDVAVTAAPTDTEKTRDVNALVVSGTVAPFIRGKNPEHANFTTTTVANVESDVAFAMSLPEAPTANPPGPGGGWLDGTPWPRPDGVSYFRVTVTAVTSSTVFTVDAQQAPVVGLSHICWLSPLTWRLHKARVTASSGSAGAYVITLDTPFPDIMVGAYIWPDSDNAETYVDNVLQAFALMGPGEKTSNASALARGFRHPPPSSGWPYTLGPHLERALTKETEVASAQFLHRTDGTTTLTGPAGVLTPQVPAAYAAPKQLVPRHLGFYRIP